LESLVLCYGPWLQTCGSQLIRIATILKNKKPYITMFFSVVLGQSECLWKNAKLNKLADQSSEYPSLRRGQALEKRRASSGLVNGQALEMQPADMQSADDKFV
jgi:hypothetical protein